MHAPHPAACVKRHRHDAGPARSSTAARTCNTMQVVWGRPAALPQCSAARHGRKRGNCRSAMVTCHRNGIVGVASPVNVRPGLHRPIRRQRLLAGQCRIIVTPPHSHSTTLKSNNITLLLRKWRERDNDAREALFDALYEDLMRVARGRLARDAGGTLEPGELVNESMLRLLGTAADYQDRTHFIAVAALKMRSVLVDHMRARMADKRGAQMQRLTLSHVDELPDHMDDGIDVMALHQALTQLSEQDPRAASMIDLSYFGGLTREEIAMVLDVSLPTVDRDLRFARAWLNRQLAA
ncbi:ECF-type sigma factor [Luteimonas sp. e5]